MQEIHINSILDDLGYPSKDIPKTYEEIVQFANAVEKKLLELYDT